MAGRISADRKWGPDLLGLSTDVKPTDRVPSGSIFFETDTRTKYILNGTEWVVYEPETKSVDVTQAEDGSINVASTSINEILLEGLDTLENILLELRVISNILNEGLNTKVILEDIREDVEDEEAHY